MTEKSAEKSLDNLLDPLTSLLGSKTDLVTLVPQDLPSEDALTELVKTHAYGLLLKESLSVQEVTLLTALLGSIRIDA